MELAERLRATIATTPFQVDSLVIKLTISMGVAECDDSNSALETLVERADRALYIAKHKGRNYVELGK